ncbi:MAG: DUF1178 family protein [Spirochaetes bacterium]|nr:DUF1178 family protein [Spirochaetota bacterium]
MISFDLECSNEHRFEGFFKDYKAFEEQLNNNMITCPICQDSRIKRLFTGCSIQAGSSSSGENGLQLNTETPNLFEMIKKAREYIQNNFENVGKNFAETARAIHYGVEEERNIYGETTGEEVKELLDEGVNVLPIPSIDKLQN